MLEGHGGALNPEAGNGTEDFERRHAALQDRLKCDVITVAEEVAKEKGVPGLAAVRAVPRRAHHDVRPGPRGRRARVRPAPQR